MTIETIKAAYLEGKSGYLGAVPYDEANAAQSVHVVLLALDFKALVVWNPPSKSFHVYAPEASVVEECEQGYKTWTENTLFDREVERLKCSVRAHARQNKFTKDGLVVDFEPDARVAARFTPEMLLDIFGDRVRATSISGQVRICLKFESA